MAALHLVVVPSSAELRAAVVVDAGAEVVPRSAAPILTGARMEAAVTVASRYAWQLGRGCSERQKSPHTASFLRHLIEQAITGFTGQPKIFVKVAVTSVLFC